MTLVSTDHARHSTSTDVRVTLALGASLRPADAAAIASWWQSPGGHGATFAALASGRAVESGALLSAIDYELSTTVGADNAGELLALAEWVRNNTPESDPDDCDECSHGRISHGARGCSECACIGYDTDTDADY